VKIEALLFGLGVVVFAPTGVVYGWVTDWQEPVGPAGLFLVAGLSLMITLYLYVTGRRIDPRPEDDKFGEIADGAGELGEFAPYSWWPLAAGAGAALTFAGAAVGVWLMLIGIGVGAFGLIGWVFEFYRGEHAH
jgi:hypothetical protein